MHTCMYNCKLMCRCVSMVSMVSMNVHVYSCWCTHKCDLWRAIRNGLKSNKKERKHKFFVKSNFDTYYKSLHHHHTSIISLFVYSILHPPSSASPHCNQNVRKSCWLCRVFCGNHLFWVKLCSRQKSGYWRWSFLSVHHGR